MGEYDMAIEDEPLNYVERKVKTLIIHPKYDDSYQDRALKTFALLDSLMKEYGRNSGIDYYNPFQSNDSDFISKASDIFDEWYSGDNDYKYDIALMKLNHPIEFQANIMPICLPQDINDFVGRRAWVTGWGRLGTYIVIHL